MMIYFKLGFILTLLYFLALFFGIPLGLFYAFLFVILGVCYNEYRNGTPKPALDYLNNTLTVFLSLVVVLSLLEIFLHTSQPRILQLDIGVRGNFSDFSSRGYLDEQVFHKQKNVFRILGLGDSFAANMNTEKQSYHDFLETRLHANGHAPIEVINAGMHSTGPGYYWHILKTYGDDFKPDLVLVGFFLGNDLFDLEFNYYFTSPFAIPEPIDPKNRFQWYCRFNNWWLYQIVNRNIISILDRLRQNRELAAGIINQKGFFSRKTFLRIERDRLALFEKDKATHFRKIWDQGAKVFKDMKDWCDQRNVKLLIAILPDQVQVETDLMEEVMREYKISRNSLDITFLNRLVTDYCYKNNIDCVDLLKEFQKNAKSANLYKIRDTHWNAAGNKLAGDIIYNYLFEHNLIALK